MVCNYCQKEVGGGGIHRLKQHLAHARGNVKPCLKVFDNLKVEMLGYLESYEADKAKNKKVQNEIGKRTSSVQIESDLHEKTPSFEEFSSFPIHDPYTNPNQKNHSGEEQVGGSTSNVKRPHGNLASFFVPRTTPGARPTIDAKWC